MTTTWKPYLHKMSKFQLDFICAYALFWLSILLQTINPPTNPGQACAYVRLWVCLPYVCIHANRYAWARERRGHRAAKDKCLFNWSWGQTALTLWQDHSLFSYSESSWLNEDISPVLPFIIYLNLPEYMRLAHVGPLWTVQVGQMGIVKKVGYNCSFKQRMWNNTLVSVRSEYVCIRRLGYSGSFPFLSSTKCFSLIS